MPIAYYAGRIKWRFIYPEFNCKNPGNTFLPFIINYLKIYIYSPSMFIQALFTITKTWKQLKCPSSNKRIKTQFTYTGEYYSAIKRKKSLSFAATWMDLQIIILSEVSQRKTNMIWYHLYVESKKMIQMNLFTKQKYTHRHKKQTYDYQDRDKLGIWN